MGILAVTILSIVITFLVAFGFSLFTLKYLKGTKVYNFVKKHLITDEDLEC